MQRLLGHKYFIAIPIAFTLIITIGSLTKPVAIKEVPTNFDKIVHFSCYFILALLWLLAFHFKKETTTKIQLVILACVIVYGIIIEILQGALTDYRTPDLADSIANSIGAIMALLLMRWLVIKLQLLKTKF